METLRLRPRTVRMAEQNVFGLGDFPLKEAREECLSTVQE